MLAHPLPRPLLLSGIENLVDEKLTRVFVFNGENISGDLDQIAFEFPFVPRFENVVKFVVCQAQGVFQNQVSFADQLHVTVFDPVVNHFDIVASAGIADPVATRDVVV